MHIDDMILVSVDDHVVEPANMFEGRLPARYADVAPRLVRKDDGTDVWMYDGREIPNIGLNAVAGRPLDEYGMEPTSFDEIREGCFDVHRRVRDMDVNGVLGSMCFSSFPNLCGQLFSRSSDLDVGLAVLRAYNDWHVDEWCGSYPGRFIPLGLPPIWDPQLMADEVRRVAKKGCHAITPAELPLRSLGSLLGCVRRRGNDRVPAHRVELDARHHCRRCADRRAHQPAAREHRAVRGGPAVVAGAAQVP
jgi:hypothetical protein